MIQSVPPMKTYVFVIPTAGRANTILRTDILRTLEQTPDTRTIIVSPFANDEAFKKEFAQSIHIPIAKIPSVRIGRLNHLREIILGINLPIFTQAKLIERSVVARQVITNLTFLEDVIWYLRAALRPLRSVFIVVFDRLEESLLRVPVYENLCRTYQVSGCILGTFTEQQDIAWLALARRKKIKAYVVDFPWSYLENRVYAVPRKAEICVWSEMMQKELITNFPFPAEQAYITGSQRYDFYAKNFPKMNREEFFSMLKLDPNRPLIVYFLGSDYWHPHQHDVAELMLRWINEDILPKNTQLLVRMGWKQSISPEFQALAKIYPNLILQRADDAPHQDIPTHLIYYSDVCLSIFSSLILDACVQDKPMVLTGFSGFSEAHKDDAAIRQMYTYEFMKEAFSTSGIRVAYDAEEFISLLTTYLAKPAVDQTGRKELVQKFFGTIDGKAGERIAKIILETSAPKQYRRY